MVHGHGYVSEVIEEIPLLHVLPVFQVDEVGDEVEIRQHQQPHNDSLWGVYRSLEQF